MERVFTMGVGIVLVVSSDTAASVQRQLDDLGF
jgi:phosphoribosylaminoimidazole (AIR) synthetase